jgi:hypothetical protein
MPQIVVVYRSISGFTKKYAQWIAEELNADLFDVKKVDAQKLAGYGLIVFGGSLHAVGINGLKLLRKKVQLSARRVVVFAVGASPPKSGILEEIWGNNFSDEEKNNVKLFYLRGGFNYRNLDRPNKVIMALFRASLFFKRKKTPDEIGMLAAFSKLIDCTKKENITALVGYVRSIVQVGNGEK